MRACLLVVMTAGVGSLSAAAPSNERCSSSTYAQLRRDFHDAVIYLPAEHAVEFCPDNTCQRFVSRRVSCDSLSEFLLVYLRYYSNYLVLEPWRKRDDVQRAVDQIMSTPLLRPCLSQVVSARPRCALDKAVAAHKIRGFDVRYEEGRVVREPISFAALEQAAP
jgi:hypothetical protein